MWEGKVQCLKKKEVNDKTKVDYYSSDSSSNMRKEKSYKGNLIQLQE